MALIDQIHSDVVKTPLAGHTKPEIIRELIDILAGAGKIEDTEAVYDAIMQRESLGSTGLEAGIAVPHAKTDAVESLTIAIGIKPDGVDFEALDGQPSKLFFLILAPPDQSGPHIEALAEIARVTKSTGFIRVLMSAASPEEVVELFQGE